MNNGSYFLNAISFNKYKNDVPKMHLMQLNIVINMSVQQDDISIYYLACISNMHTLSD